MPKGVYKRTEKHRRIQRRALNSPETVEKCRLSHLGKVQPCSQETREKIRLGNLGKVLSQETRERMRLVRLGEKNPMWGRTDLFVGERNPNWRGGISTLPYAFDFNEKLKERIRRRDSYICQLCGKMEFEVKDKLRVHHIDYDKQNSNLNNLISLCNSCNTRVNFNRIFWQGFFSIGTKLEVEEPKKVLED